MNEMTLNDPRRYAPLLWLLLGLFTFRVTTQLLLTIGDIPYLPPFEQWHSDAIPYELLLASQFLILWIMVKQTMLFFKGTVTSNRTTGKVLFCLGVIYFVSMFVRLVLGLTVFTESRWFTNYIPTFFHIVLASFVLVISFYHLGIRGSFIQMISAWLAKLTPWVIYPLLMTFGLVAHVLMAYIWKLPVSLSTYLPVVVGAVVVAVLEYARPHRNSWLPNRDNVQNDALYMGVVQLVLPKLVALAFVFLLINPFQNSFSVLTNLWPHEWPIGLQAILMILSADFLRYWLHRFAHTNKYLWRLHAVHHSPDKLYWLNVARFHPLEKALQMVFDVLPFMILGVSEYVIALYFVFYAINGFFQHSNIELRFGWLNYIISSPQLHRWHHSKLPQESNMNYGNNFIVWDLLFGSYYLPKDREIEDLGLQVTNYPQDFARQLKAPFAQEASAE